MATKIIDFNPVEPLRENRWLIETNPTKINSCLFRKYRMFNEGDKIIFKTEFYETVNETYNPTDLLNITDITLKYLDPVGNVVCGFNMVVEGLNFEKKHSYSSDGLLKTKMRFIVKHIQSLYVNKEEKQTYGDTKEY